MIKVSLESKILEFLRLSDEIMRRRPVIENKTFQDEVVHLDFKTYKKCTFINCLLVIEFGLFSLDEPTAKNCTFQTKEGSPARLVADITLSLQESIAKEKLK